MKDKILFPNGGHYYYIEGFRCTAVVMVSLILLENRLSRGDFSQVYRALSSQSYKWFKIGQNLGFTLEELNNIQFSQCMNRHSSDEALEKMLRTWLDWAPNSTDRVHKRRNYPTMDALRQAVVQAGLSDSILSSIP